MLCKKNERCEIRWYLSGEGKEREEAGGNNPVLHSLRKHNQNFSFYHPTLTLASGGPAHSFRKPPILPQSLGEALNMWILSNIPEGICLIQERERVKQEKCHYCSHFVFSLWKIRTHQEFGLPGSSVSKETACSAGDLGSIPGLGRSPGEGNDNPLQHSCLENPVDRGAWWATVPRVAKSGTQLKQLSKHTAEGMWPSELSYCWKTYVRIKHLRFYENI